MTEECGCFPRFVLALVTLAWLIGTLRGAPA